MKISFTKSVSPKYNDMEKKEGKGREGKGKWKGKGKGESAHNKEHLSKEFIVKIKSIESIA